MKVSNPLAAWLADRQMTYAAFARLVGADRARIQRVATDERSPGLELALAIQKETGIAASTWPARRGPRPSPVHPSVGDGKSPLNRSRRRVDGGPRARSRSRRVVMDRTVPGSRSGS